MKKLRDAWMVGVALMCAASSAGCEGRPRTNARTEAPKRSGPAVSVIDLSAGVPEQETQSLFSLAPKGNTFDELLDAMAKLEKDKDSVAVLVRFGSAQIGGARAQEIATRMARLREKRPVHCHADGLTNTTYMLASRACTKIVVSPAGEVEAIGLAAQIVYLRKLLVEELHFDIDMLQVGKFKGAEEPLTRDGPSDEARASLEGTLKELRAAWLETATQGRETANLADLLEDGPYSPPTAKAKGLIDEVGYADDTARALRDSVNAKREQVVFGPGAGDKPEELDDLVRALAGDSSSSGPIALVRATGSISMTGSSGVLGGKSGIAARDFNKTIAKLEKDDDVKAVVLRIDSPGGSALASDLMWHQLMRLRAKKPLVVSVGEMAASGGYYMACTANAIFAQPMSIVGSIGVVGGKIGFGGALERWGVHTETFPAAVGKPGAGARAAYESPMVPWDDATRGRVLESMTGVYDLFLARVAEGRGTSVDKVAPSAEGRIFGGREAKARGLIDEVGGLTEAIARAKSLANQPDGARVVVIGSKPTFLDALDPTAAEGRAASPARILERVASDVVPYASSLGPLSEGERTVCALPFSLVVR
ncbi:MAG: S49 family peptidase [Myxococcales bacterium]|nr:S49 family peptidase [Myxococcales bacterium]